MSALSDAMGRALRGLPCILGVAGVAGITSPWWKECTSIAGKLSSVELGVFSLVTAAMFLPLIISWESSDASLGKRLRVSVSVLLGVGLLAAIAIPNQVGAMDRGAQKRTMGDMRTLATALELESQARGRYPVVDGSAEDAVRLLGPAPAGKPVPTRDSWGNMMLVRSDGEHYAIVSLGCCGQRDVEDPFTLPAEGTNQYRADLVFRDGTFWRFPDGSQE